MAVTTPATVRRRVASWATVLVVAGAVYACKDLLDVGAQGVLDEQTLANKAGVEGALIAAYRMLDWNNGVGGAWGTAASNWVWGSITSDDAYKGSEATDAGGPVDIELYNWATAVVEGYLNDKWRACYMPFVSLIMALLAVPFGSWMGSKGTLVGVGLSVVVAMAYWGAFSVFRRLGAAGVLTPFLGAWGANILFGLAGSIGLFRLRT